LCYEALINHYYGYSNSSSFFFIIGLSKLTYIQEPDMSEQDDMNFSSGVAAFEAKNFSQAMQLLNPYAEEGDAEAQFRVAIMHQNGLGVVANPMAAYKWMKASAEQGLAMAQHSLGFMYMEGECVDQNGEKAVEWFTKAADQGLVGSLTTLAMMYEEGKGIERDPEKARELYKKAGFDQEEV